MYCGNADTHTHTHPYFNYQCQAGLKDLQFSRNAPQKALTQEIFFPLEEQFHLYLSFSFKATSPSFPSCKLPVLKEC